MRHSERLQILPIIAALLGDSWQFNSLLTQSDKSYWLSNKRGLYIQIYFAYGENLPQWELQIKSNRYYGGFQSIAKIGCSFDKGLQSIVSDIKTRLLSESQHAYNEIIKNREKKQSDTALRETRKFVVNTIRAMHPIEQTRHNRHNEYNVLSHKDEETKIGYLTHRHDKIDDFDLRLYNLNAEQIIKILNIIKES